jgi:hypothetical protein
MHTSKIGLTIFNFIIYWLQETYNIREYTVHYTTYNYTLRRQFLIT